MSDDLGPWPEKVYLLHPFVKTFGDMVTNPERRKYVIADRMEEVERERDDYAHKLMEANNTYSDMHLDIERLSDKLAKAVEAMKMAVKMWQKSDNGDPNIRMDNCINAIVSIVPVLAELEGEK